MITSFPVKHDFLWAKAAGMSAAPLHRRVLPFYSLTIAGFPAQRQTAPKKVRRFGGLAFTNGWLQQRRQQPGDRFRNAHPERALLKLFVVDHGSVAKIFQKVADEFMNAVGIIQKGVHFKV